MEAGSIVVKIKGDTTDLQTALNKLQTELKETKEKANDTTTAFINAEIILEGLKKAYQIITGVIKESVKAWGEQEMAEKRLSAQIGNDIKTYTDFAGQVQKITTVGDEMVVSMQSLAKTMGVQNAKLNETTQNAISLSKAFGVDLNTSVKLVVLAQNKNYDALGRYIPALRSAKDDTEKFNILQKAFASGWNIAQSEVNTLTGSLAQYKNAQGEVFEGIGHLTSAIAKGFIPELTKAQFALAEFISSKETLNIFANIAGIINIVSAAFKELGKIIYDTIIVKIVSAFKSLTSGFSASINLSNILNGAIMAVAFAFKLLSIPLGVVIDFFKIFINFQFNLIKVLKETALTIGAFFKALTDPLNKKGWEDLKNQADETWNKIKELGQDAVNDTTSIMGNMVKKIQNLPTEAEQLARDIRKGMDKAFSEGKGNLIQNYLGSGDSGAMSQQTTGGGGDSGSGEKKTGATHRQVKEIVMPPIKIDLFVESLSEISNAVGMMNNNIGNSFNKIVDSIQNASNVILAIGQGITAVAEGIGQTIVDAMGIAKAAIADFYASQLEGLSAFHEAEIEEINTNLENQIELIENDGMTREQKRQQDLAALQAKLAAETDAEKKAQLQEQIATIQKEIAITKANEEAKEKKQKSDKEYAKKKYKLDVEQFNIKKGMDIAQVWISAAVGVIGAWAQSISQLGPIAGSIVAGVLTGVILALAGVQTGIIASKAPPPAPFASGGIVPGNSFYGDQINARLNSGEMVLNQEQQMALFDMINNGNGRGQQINLVIDGDVIKTWTINNRRREAYLTY